MRKPIYINQEYNVYTVKHQSHFQSELETLTWLKISKKFLNWLVESMEDEAEEKVNIALQAINKRQIDPQRSRLEGEKATT